MALVHDYSTDFVLFPREQPYLDLSDSRREELFGQHFSADMAQQFPDFADSSYDSFAPVSTYAPIPSYYAPQLVLNGHEENIKQVSHRYTPQGSPSTSTSQPPSTLSSASGASARSTASSAVGSPYSHATHSLNGHEQWSESAQGLGLAPSILHNDGSFSHDSFVAPTLEHALFYDNDKFSGSFVGESQKVPSSSIPTSLSISSSLPAVSSCSASQTFVPAFPSPPSAVDPSACTRDVTIDTILEEVNSTIGTPTPMASPGIPPSPNPSSPMFQRRMSAPETDTTFKSPTTPASAMSPYTTRAASPFVVRGYDSRQHQPALPPPPTRSGPYDRPTAPLISSSHTHGGQFQTSFFGHSSGRFIAPLESSCWFPLPSVLTHVLSILQLQFCFLLVKCPNRNAQEQMLTEVSKIDPALIQPFDTPVAHTTNVPYPGIIHAFHPPTQTIHPASPALSDASSQGSHRTGSARFKHGSASPYLHTMGYHPYPQAPGGRRLSIASTQTRYSQESPRSVSLEYDEDGKERGRCPVLECGRLFKDIKAHMLTHQPERPEKCPITSCDYHHKGFARKYDKNRHTLTHYKGTMVCGFCPGSGSAAEKSFNRADVFKRHLTSVHGVEQSPPNSRKKSPAAGSNRKLSTYSSDATGKCSTCTITFTSPQEFYEHLDECVLRVVQQEEPSEAINERRLAEVANDDAVKETLDRHMIPSEIESTSQSAAEYDDEDQEDDEDQDDEDNEDWSGPSGANPRAGKGAIKATKRGPS